jgi:hypothetical protein
MIPKKKSATIETKWCGAPTIASDCLSITVLICAVLLEQGIVVWVAIALFTLGPPIIHLNRGYWSRAAVSFALRVLGPWISVAILSPSSGGSNWLSSAIDGLIGMALGIPIIMFIDWIFISRCKAKN